MVGGEKKSAPALASWRAVAVCGSARRAKSRKGGRRSSNENQVVEEAAGEAKQDHLRGCRWVDHENGSAIFLVVLRSTARMNLC